MRFTKCCKKCNQEKPFEEFHLNKRQSFGYDNRCRQCRSEQQATNYKKNWFKATYTLKKSYCTKRNLDFDLTPEYLENIWTDSCPIFNQPFERHNKSSSWSPALDRVDPSKGYTQGNVVYISARANRIKYDANQKELEQILNWLKGTQKAYA
jgi:hypothetical protein